MDFDELIEFAKRHTNIIRERKNLLYTFGATKLPYLCFSVAEETNNIVIRDGEVTAEKPNIAIPGRDFTFDGFADDDEDDDGLLPILMARGVKMPPAKYVNTEQKYREENGNLEEVIAREIKKLEQHNDIRTGIIHAPEKIWRFSILIYVGAQMTRSIDANLAEHFERLRLNERDW